MKLSKVSKSRSKSSRLNLVFLLIVLSVFALLCVGLYFAYKHYNDYSISGKETKDLITEMWDGRDKKHFSSNQLPPSAQGHEYNINLWLFINDYSYNLEQDKIILVRKIQQTKYLEIKLDKNQNNLTVTVATRTPKPSIPKASSLNNIETFYNLDDSEDLFEEDCTDGCVTTSEPEDSDEDSDIYLEDPVDIQPDNELLPTTTPKHEENYILSYEIITIKNISLQRWVNINVSLINRALDIFIDGKLVKTIKLNGLSVPSKGNLDISPDGGFNGFINKLSYTNKGLSPNEINKIVKKGPEE
tara:strand:- start:1132 stop:2034 length:903 start_codon:yes stop_codon:yes gene_type:complete